MVARNGGRRVKNFSKIPSILIDEINTLLEKYRKGLNLNLVLEIAIRSFTTRYKPRKQFLPKKNLLLESNSIDSHKFNINPCYTIGNRDSIILTPTIDLFTRAPFI